LQLLTLGISYKTAPISVRDSLANKKEQLKRAVLKAELLDELFILSTCNRFEIYCKYNSEKIIESKLKTFFIKLLRKYLKESLKYKKDDFHDYIYYYSDLKAVKHIYQVAAGLDSLVIGEDQILAQLKSAFKVFKKEDITGTYLNQLCLEAIRVGKKVRTETTINQRAVSISYAAVELARDIFGELDGQKIMILGAGKTSELTLKNLVNYGAEGILVANRTYSSGQKLAQKYGGEVIHWDKLKDKLIEVDILIASTAAPHRVLHYNEIRDIVKNKRGPLFLIDIALPRDIEERVAEILGVHLHNIDDLKGVVEKNLDLRQGEMAKAEKIIETEVQEYDRWMRERFCVPLIKEMRAEAEEIKENEVKRALHLLENSELRAEEVLEQLAHRLLNKFLHQPTVGLKKLAVDDKDAAQEKLELAQKIFAVGEDNETISD